MLKKCKEKNCLRTYYAKGYCRKHYLKYEFAWYAIATNNGTWKKRGICSVKGCKLGIYAKSRCRSHYLKKRRKDNRDA